MQPPPALVEALRRSPMASWFCQRGAFTIAAVNPAALSLFGWPPANVVGKSMRELWVDPSSAEAEFLAAARDSRFATWLQRTSDPRAVEVNAAIVPIGEGGEGGWLVQVAAVRPAAPRAPSREILDRLGALLDHAREGIALVTSDGITEYVSPAVEKILGVPRETFVGKLGSLLSNAEDVVRTRPHFRELLREPGGTRTFVLRNASKVTDREEARRALEAARQRFEYLLSATSAITYTAAVEPPHGATFVSENVGPVLGYAPGDFIGDPSFWADRVHPDDRDRILAEIPRIFERGHQVHDYRFRDASGAYRWMHDDVVLVRDDRGEPKEMVGFCFDVTARREAELALARSEANFRALIEHLPIAVLVHRDDRVVYANPAWLKLLGASNLDEVLGTSALATATPGFRERIFELRRRLAADAGGAPMPALEGELARRDGTTVAVEVEKVQLDFDGSPASVVLARDLSERKTMLANLAASDRLASLGTLAAGVAHEINNPLSFVHANLALLSEKVRSLLVGTERAQGSLQQGERRTLGREIEQLLRDAREGAARIRSLVRDLRTLSHPDRDSETLVDVREVLSACVRMAENEIRHRARFAANVDEVPRVRGNASRLQQVILNLLVNAVQAIPEGRIEENEICVRLRLDGPDRVLLEVSDTGSGIPESVVGHIFDPFFTTKPVGIGTGLGLFICHSIVKSMRGDIAVETRAGRGSTFQVTLPAAREDVAAAAVPADEDPAPIDRKRILVIDDEEAIGRVLVHLLGRDHDVVVDRRASDALALLQKGASFDVVLCDLMMPGMSGTEFYEKLAEVAPEIAPRVVFLTGGAFTATARDFLERVPNLRLEKPFDIKSLHDAIQTAGSSRSRSA